MTACSFKDFAREWGAVLVHDPATSLENLFDAYQRADPADARTATVEDYTDLWTAAKRANMEWEATCMVRSVHQSVALDGAVTPFHLMTSMTCWAATREQNTAQFFKSCKTQVRDVVAHVVARCSVWAGEEAAAAAVLYEEIAFCVALELFGWHDSLLTCLRTVTMQQAGPVGEQDVLLYLATVAQYLTPKYVPRGFSAGSTPNLTTGRTSALSSSSEHDGADGKEDVAVASDAQPSPPQRCATREGASPAHVRVEHSHAVGAARWEDASASALASPTRPPPPPPPPQREPPASPLVGRPGFAPQQAPRSRGTPQPSPKNSTSAVAAGPDVSPLPCRRDSAVSSTARERARKEEIKEKRWPIAPKKGRAGRKKDPQGCVAF